MNSQRYSTLFDVSSADFENEAHVETRLLAPLFQELGYPPTSILPKESVPKLNAYEGSQIRSLEVDFILLDPDNQASTVVEAKAPSGNISKYWGQAASYALSYNQQLPSDEKGIEFLLLSNGHMTTLYSHDRSHPIVTLRLDDFSSGSPPLIALKNYIRYKSRKEMQGHEEFFETIPPAELNLLFDECHNIIWKKEKLSPTDAFYEFCKFVFMKIQEDRKRVDGTPRSEVPLTLSWLTSTEPTSRHPVRDILFVGLRTELEDAIRRGKKRIFEPGETFRLSASTCKELIARFENINLSAIDEDLNGRMFERFLNQAVRGKELGQYFTPRPVVDFMTRIALHDCDITDPPRVIDACAGTGGFLIEAMAYLLAAVRNDNRLTNFEKEELGKRICDEQLFGIEANERVSRIARVNMYLHGDGGSHVFLGDGLDSAPAIESDMKTERKDEITEHGEKIRPDSYDLAITNPPFSMKYSADNEDENRILQQREISQGLKSVKSNLLFLDRYHELLKPGGELLIVIDDTVLNGPSQTQVREWILDKFVLLGVHSLPFNAFFKAKANIKTSILHLRKKQRNNEVQGYVFMSITNNIGHDNHSRDTIERNNLVDVLMTYFEWKRTGQIRDTVVENQDPEETLECPQQTWLLSPDMLIPERLDSFYYAPDLASVREKIQIKEEANEVRSYSGRDFTVVSRLTNVEKAAYKDSGEILKYIEIGDVTPYGLIVSHAAGPFEELPSRGLYRIRSGDVLVALNNSSRGTVVLVPDQYDGAICTSGFLVIRPESNEQGMLLWYALRSEYCRAQIYYLAQTASQPELKLSVWNEEFVVPLPAIGEPQNTALSIVAEFMDRVSALNDAGNVKLI